MPWLAQPIGTSCSVWPRPFAFAKPAPRCILLKQKLVTCGIHLAVSGRPLSFTVWSACCVSQCHQIKSSRKAQPRFQRGNRGSLTPQNKRRRDRRGGSWLRLLLMICLDVSCLIEREVWLWQSSRFYLQAGCKSKLHFHANSVILSRYRSFIFPFFS